MSPLPRRSSMTSSLPVPRHRASTVASTAAKKSQEASHCRLPLPNRKNVLQGCSKKNLTELEKPTVDTKNLKSFEKQAPRAPNILGVKNRRFSTGSFSLSSTRKLDTKFKLDAFPKGNLLNATYYLSHSDGKRTGQFPLKTKSSNVVMVQRCLPNISVASSIPEHELTQSAYSLLPLMEPSNLSSLFCSLLAEECFSIAAELNDESNTCPLGTVGAISPVPVTSVSLISDEPIPFDCSHYSFCSETSPAKSPQFDSTSKLQENDFKNTSGQLIPTEAKIKTEDSSVSPKLNSNDIETGTLPCSPSGNLLLLNESMMLSDPNEHKDGAPKHGAHSRNILSKSPTVSNCKSSLCTADLIPLNGSIVLNGTANTPSSCTKNDSSCESAMPAKTLSNCKSPLSKRDLLLCEGAMLSGNKIVVPMHRDCFGNELHKATALFDCMPSPFTGDLIQLNETMTLTSPFTRDFFLLKEPMTVRDDDATFDSSKRESSFGNDLQASTLSNCKLSLSTGDLVQLNGTMTLDDHKNATFDTSKHEGSLGNDTNKATSLSNCKLSLSTGDLVQLNGTMTLDDHKNATFDTSKHEGSLGNDTNKATSLSNCKLSLSTGDLVQLNGTMTLDDHKNATIDTSKHEGSLGNDTNKATSLSNCKLSLSTGDLVQLNGTMTLDDHKNATIDTSKHEGSLGNDTNKATSLSNCKLSLSTGDLVQLNGTMTLDDHKNATFDTSKHEGSLGNDTNKATSLSNCKLSLSTGDQVQLNGTMTLDDHKNATFDKSKHEVSLGNDTSKVTTLSNCKLSLSTGDVVQLNGTGIVTDCKDATFDASKHEDILENDLPKTTDLPNCKLSRSSGGSNEVMPLSSKNLKLVRKCEGHQGSALDSVAELQQGEPHGDRSDSKDSNLTLNLGKGIEATCTEKRLIEAKRGGDGDVCCPAELHKGAPAQVQILHLGVPSQNQELNISESAYLAPDDDVLTSEWAPFCMSTPSSVTLKLRLEYLPFDHSFQTSSSTLEDDTRVAVECSLKPVETKDCPRSASTDVTETKTSSRKMVNAPRPKEQWQPTKIVTKSFLKPVSHLAGARRKNVKVTPESAERKCDAEMNSLPLPARISRPGSSSLGRGGKPPVQPPNISKMCLPKPRQVLGRPSSLIGTGQNAANKKLPLCQTGVHAKIPPKAQPNQLLTKAMTKIPGIKSRSPLASSQPPAQGTKKAESKLVELFNLAKLHTMQELAVKVAVLGLENADLRQKRENSTLVPEETNIDAIIKELEEKVALLELQNAALRQEKKNPTHVPE